MSGAPAVSLIANWWEKNKRHHLGVWYFTHKRSADDGILSGSDAVFRLEGGKTETEGNARELVRRWNAHEGLIEIAKEALAALPTRWAGCWREDDPAGECPCHMHQKRRRLIATIALEVGP